MPPPSSTSLLDLPDAILIQVVQMLPVHNRIYCACVSTRLNKSVAAAAEAATATATAATATDSIRFIKHSDCDQRSSFRQYLQKHGKHLSQLEVAHMNFSELPCSNLRRLDLKQCTLQAASAEQSILHATSKVTSLSMHQCKLTGSQDSFSLLLGPLQKLQYLSIRRAYAKNTSGAAAQLAGTLLQSLSNLTCLDLDDSVKLTTSAVQHISSLPALQELSLELMACSGESRITAGAFAGIHSLQLLTSLHLSAPLVLFSTGTTPGLSQLTALKVLSLSYVQGLQPAVLGALQSLEQLHLHEVPMPLNLGGAGALLHRLQQLPLLQKVVFKWLNLRLVRFTATYGTLMRGPSAISHLEIEACQVSRTLWQQLFQESQQALQLQSLIIPDYDGIGSNVVMDLQELQRMVNCCPGLQDLDLTDRLERGLALSVLQQLPVLTRLRVNGVSQESVKDLARLTGLQELHVTATSDLFKSDPETQLQAASALMCLTALTELTRLEADYGVSFRRFKLVNEAPAAALLNVSSQLHQALQAAMTAISDATASHGERLHRARAADSALAQGLPV